MSIVVLTTSCKKDTQVGANLTWDDKGFGLTENWKASLYEDIVTFKDDGDYDVSPLEAKSIKVGDKTVFYDVSISGYSNFTILVFNDVNKNNKFDLEEINYTYGFDGVDPGESVSIDITVRY